MKVYYFTREYNSYGPTASHSNAGRFLERAVDGKAFGVSELSVFANFPTALPPRPSLEGYHEQFHQRLATLPQVKYERKKGRLTIEFESKLGLAEDILGVWHDPLSGQTADPAHGKPTGRRPLDPQTFRQALEELHNVLRELQPQICGKIGPRFAAFVDEVERATFSAPKSDDEILQLGQRYFAEGRAALAKAPWWEKFGIDWDDYHPQARELLDDPVFWNPTDDTWFDVLADFKKWRPRHKGVSPLAFLDKLFRTWGVAEGEARPASDDRVSPAAMEDLVQTMRDEARVALAFAQIKMEGTCNADARESALGAIERLRDEESVGSGADSKESMAMLDALKKRLETLPKD